MDGWAVEKALSQWRSGVLTVQKAQECHLQAQKDQANVRCNKFSEVFQQEYWPLSLG